MRDLLDITTWSAAALLVAGLLLPADSAPAPEPAVELTPAFEWRLTDQPRGMMDSPPPAMPPVTRTASRGCGCGCASCTGGPDCQCACESCACRGQRNTLTTVQPAPANPPPSLPEPERAVFRTRHHESLYDAWQEVVRTGKPAIVHFWGDGCRPCIEMDQYVFGDQDVIAALDDFVFVKIHLDSLTPADRRAWNVTQMPTDFVVSADWSRRSRLRLTTDPQEYLAQLQVARRWSAAQKPERSVIQRSQPATGPVYYYEPTYRPTYSSPSFYGGEFWGGGGCYGGNCSGGI